ncbi:MAG: hypothetical protein JNK56_04800 [Myxococcales bacterium]|nr:hypothetical protein [Myxococcales bacterium]
MPILPEDFVPDANLRDAVERLDLYLRASSSSETIEGLDGRTLYIDRSDAAGTDRLVASPRVSAAMLQAVLDTLALLDASADQFRAALLEDLARNKDNAEGIQFDPVAYARHIASLDEDNPTRRAFELCATLFAQIDQSGLTPSEAVYCKRKAIQPLTDGQTITPEQLSAAIEAYLKIRNTVATNQ